jgi:competence protein ComEC
VLHKEIPFHKAPCPTLCRDYCRISDKYTSISIAVTVCHCTNIAGLLSSSEKLTDNVIFGAALSVLLFSSGFLLIRKELATPDRLSQTETVFVCRIKTFPEPKPKSFAVTAELEGMMQENGQLMKLNGAILIYYTTADSATPDLTPGDIITFRATPSPITNRGNPFEFDYRAFMHKKGILYYTFLRKESLISHYKNERKNLREKAIIVGRDLTSVYLNSGVDADNLPLLSALTLGQKELIDEETQFNFSKAGVMHIMAVSGLHAGILSMFVFSILFFLKGKLMPVRVIISVVILWGFAFITGLPSSVERASLMFTFLHAGKLIKRPVNSINSILAAAFFMLLITPSDLTSLGFQLSFSAVLFISGFYRRVAGLFRTGILPVDRLWQMAVVSVLAQLGTMPFTLNAFGQFPLWFLPANLLIIPLATIIMILAFIVLMISPISIISGAIASILNLLLKFISATAGFIANLPGPASFGKVLPLPEALLLMLLIWSLLYFLFFQKVKSPVITMILTIIFLSVSLFRYTKTINSSEIIIYNTLNAVSVAVRSGDELWVISETDVVDQAILRHASALSLKIRPTLGISVPYKIAFAGTTMLITETYYDTVRKNLHPAILVTKKVPALFPVSDIDPGTRIIVTSSSSNVLMLTEDDNFSEKPSVHFIPEQGAIVLNRCRKNTKRVEKVDLSVF